MRTELFMYFCIKNYIYIYIYIYILHYSERPLNPSVVYTTDRSKAVVPMLFLFYVAL